MIKKVIVAIAIIFTIGGCKTSQNNVQHIQTTNSTQKVNGSFNDERYVWESFIFTTNRIEKVK